MIQIRLFKAKDAKNLEGVVNRELQSIQQNPNVDQKSFNFQLHENSILVSFDVKPLDKSVEQIKEAKSILDLIVERPKAPTSTK